MASYSPLQMHDVEHHTEDSEDAILLSGKHFTFEPPVTEPPSRLSTLAVLGLSILAVACALASYFASASIYERRDVHRLRQPNQHPGLETIEEFKQKQKAPVVFFPSTIVRVNKILPDKVYTSGSHVILSDDDSMFFQWHMPRSNFTACYIDTLVPTPEHGLAANKTYTSSGSLNEIQIWNVTTPAEPMRNLSWNSRPERIALMGTVAFLPAKEKIKQLQLEDGWQSLMRTRFSCGEEATVSIEVACEGCTLEFEQILSTPPLAFDVVEIG